MKLATLCLVRAGHSVKIRSGSEVWTPAIVRSEKFNADVLVFDIQGGRQDAQRVRVEVGGIDKETWNRLRERFLFLTKIKDDDRVETTWGDLLLSEKMKGKIFVKGIFVQHEPEMNFGYNFRQADLDRDRRMVESFSLNWEARKVWSEAAAARPDLLPVVVSCLERNTADVAGCENAATYLPGTVLDHVVQAFVARHGDQAIPVATTAESRDIEHYGRTGVVVPRALRAVLATKLGDFEAVKKNLAKETTKVYGWHELEGAQKVVLETAMALLTSALPAATLDAVDVVDFNDGRIEGMYKDGRVQVAARMLADRVATLRVLVHEFAHAVGGGDGDKEQVNHVEILWSKVVAELWKK